MTPTPSRDEMLARLAKLRAANEAATSWGAAVGARSVEIRNLERRLAVSASDGVQGRIPDCQQCNEQSGKQLSRAAEMLHIASTMILAHCPEETYFYDGTDCDGICIADDCLSARESLLELADTHRTESAESTPPAIFSDPTSQPPESGER